MQIRRLTGALGASVSNIDLNSTIGDNELGELRHAFLDNCVLVFRGQALGPEAQLAFARRWGEPAITPMLTYLDGHPGILALANQGKAHAVTENWHYDSTFMAAPPSITILCAQTIPVGGDTMWSNQYRAYDRLSDGLKALLQGVRGRFSGVRIHRATGGKGEPPSAFHPIVRTHPETGRMALYVGHPDTLPHLENMTIEESRPLLDYLYATSVSPDNLYRHTWKGGDVVMWDNRCTMHYAVHDYGDAPRVLNRVTLSGTEPY